MKNLGEKTLSECKDKKLRSSEEYWEDRVNDVGVVDSPYLKTPQQWIDKFTKRHKHEIIKHTVDRDVLEVGCGYGRNLEAFRFCKSYTGIDFVPALVERAASRISDLDLDPQFGVICMNLRDIADYKYRFDVIVGVSVITSVEYEFSTVLNTLKSVLNPEGYILWLEEEWMRIDWSDY
jgi:SAM-dependent methyltransferase